MVTQEKNFEQVVQDWNFWFGGGGVSDLLDDADLESYAEARLYCEYYRQKY